jgi:hypothetical protein
MKPKNGVAQGVSLSRWISRQIESAGEPLAVGPIARYSL